MKNIYDDIGHPSKKNYNKISKLTEPLKSFFGIDRFWRNSHRKDGSYSVLGNYPPVAEAFFGQNLYVGHPYFRDPKFFRSGYVLPELFHSKEYEDTQGRLKGEGNCHHVLICVQKTEHGFVEHGFSTSHFRPGFEAIYLNHLKAIHQFIYAFEQTAAKLIQEAEEYRVDISRLIGTPYRTKPALPDQILTPDQELNFLAVIEGRGDKVLGLKSLTQSERVCLKNYLAGSTASQIAQKLYRSPRTIEAHLENAKAKLGVKSRSTLFEVLMPFRDVL